MTQIYRKQAMMKTTFLLIFSHIIFVANCIATEMNDNDLYSFTFLLSPIINEVPQTKDINPDKGDWKIFSFQVANLDFDENVHARYDNAVSIKIKEYDNVVFNVYFIKDIAMKIEKITSPSMEITYYHRDIPTVNNLNDYPKEYSSASNIAYRNLIKYGDLLFYLKIGKNKIGLKKVQLGKDSLGILIKYYNHNYIQNLSLVNGTLYNVATGRDPNEKSPWGKLFFSVTMAQKKIVAGTIKMEDLNFDCSFFPAVGLKRCISGTNGTWSDVTIWDKNGKIVRQLSYHDWIEITNRNTK